MEDTGAHPGGCAEDLAMVDLAMGDWAMVDLDMVDWDFGEEASMVASGD